MKRRNENFTEEQVELEIERLKESEDVKLAIKEKQVRNKRRQYMYQLRWYEKRGQELRLNGITMDTLDNYGNERIEVY